ncbi:hypothetical protein BT63DRAFT_124885 [Microthyrium microscopicum]|uniref:Uncharacterized protein n=1 Tax=Microthyrium microscopicum TaxID=703497 RepID=A0A6A6TVI6_9PEZI|nr:hypothetical protein BT63DRAFT_124885 [Microthyrium microscopicum]
MNFKSLNLQLGTSLIDLPIWNPSSGSVFLDRDTISSQYSIAFTGTLTLDEGVKQCGEVVWTCCDCGSFNGVLANNPSCFSCNTPKCSRCITENTKDRVPTC